MDMKLFLQILANATGLKREMGESKNAVSRFTQGAKREFDALKGSMGSVQGMLAGVGISIGAIQQLTQSARLDKGLTQVRQTAGEGAAMVKGLRKEFFLMGKETGQQVEGLKDGFDGLIQSGQSWKAALESTKGINIAAAVTGANSATLAGGLTVGATAFNIDLEQPGKALELLDKMTVAGRLGNAELQNLSDIFARVGVNAASAGMGFDKTLAFIETLSLAEKNPERLATLTDSTLRVFTNLKYMAEAQKGTGVRFFATDGSRRDPIAVLQDIKKRWDTLKTDKQRAGFIQQAFGKADLDTIKGIRSLLSGTALDKATLFADKIGAASGTLKKDLPDALNNAVDQAGRLKNNLREAADSFAQPVNKALADLVQWTMGAKKNGGLELSGKEMLAGAGGVVLSAIIAKRYGSALAGRLLARGGSTAIGVAEGKALEAAAGITPVFVTNWPGSAMPGGVPVPTPGGGKWALPLAAAGVTTAVVAAPFVSKAISEAQRENGWGSQTYGRGSKEYEVMGIGRGTPRNDIKIDVHFDELARAFTRVSGKSTSVNAGSMNRGSLFDAIATTGGM